MNPAEQPFSRDLFMARLPGFCLSNEQCPFYYWEVGLKEEKDKYEG